MWHWCPEPVKDRAGVGFCVTGSPHSSAPEQDTRLTAALERGQVRARNSHRGFPMNRAAKVQLAPEGQSSC